MAGCEARAARLRVEGCEEAGCNVACETLRVTRRGLRWLRAAIIASRKWGGGAFPSGWVLLGGSCSISLCEKFLVFTKKRKVLHSSRSFL